MRIEICGGIGAGKTTFATSGLIPSLQPLLENFKINPFWEAFYANPGQYAFETELTFLLQHYHQIKAAGDSPVICDFSFIQDLAFARMGLNGNRLKIFEGVAAECLAEIGEPSLTIHLDCSTSTLVNRIAARGRPEETKITTQFLDTLNQAIEAELKKDSLIIFKIDTDQLDFRSRDADVDRLISKIHRFLS